MVETEQIRVLVVCGTLEVGGAELQLAKFAPLIDRRVFNIQIAHYGTQGVSYPKTLLENGGIKLNFFDLQKLGKTLFFRKMTDFIRCEKFDIVHAWFESANHYAGLPAFMAHTPVKIGGMRGKTGLQGFFKLSIYSLMNLQYSGWIVNSREMKEFIKKQLYFTKNCPIFIVPNGVLMDNDKRFKKIDLTFFDELKSDRPVVGIVGNLRPIKNHLLFVEMAKYLTNSGVNTDYWIIGDGPMRPEIEHAIWRNNLTDRVKMLGYRADVDSALSRMDIFVLTSNSESCPNALLEAMKASLPVVATNCTSLEDMIEEGVNGFIVPVGNIQELCKRVRQVLADDELRLRMGQASYRMVKERFSMTSAVKELENAYIELLKSKSKTNLGLRKKIQKLGLI